LSVKSLYICHRKIELPPSIFPKKNYMQNNLIGYFLTGIILLLSLGGIKAQESAKVRYTVDNVLPEVYCINGLAINFTKENRERTISAREINIGSSDNIEIKTLKLEKHRSGATAPEDSATDKIEFTAKDLGKHKIDLWVGDFGGNWARKSTYILVADLTIAKKETPNKVYAKNYPNPFSGSTRISFEMQNPGLASLSILDSKGILIKEIKAIYPKGKQAIEINKSDLPTAGIYYYQITTEQGVITKNMIMVNY